MKRLLFTTILFLTLFFSQTLRAQTFFTIPDPAFATYLQTNFPSCMVGNQLDLSCPLLLSTISLNVTGSSISDITGIHYFSNLGYLTVSSTNLSWLPVLPSNLVSLKLPSNDFTAYPNNIPASVHTLDISYNQITSVPSLPPGLTTLDADYNPGITFAVLPASLEHLKIDHCNLSTLPLLPAGLKSIDCGYNPLGSLPTLPPGLIALIAPDCQLLTLPTLPTTLVNLDFSINMVSSLPATLPPGMLYFNGNGNPVGSIPPLPAGLKNLACNVCQLSALPPLPSTLEYLSCRNNQISALPMLPNGLMTVKVGNNLLTSFLDIPQAILMLDVEYNAITCFGPFPPNAGLIVWGSGNPVTCLPNYPAYPSSNLGALPLCPLGSPILNPAGCNGSDGIGGAVYHDQNSDCNLNGLEYGLQNFPIKLYDNVGNFLEATSTFGPGNYFFNRPPGTWRVEIDTLGQPFKTVCVQPGIDSTVSLSSIAPIVQELNFGLECKPGYDLGIMAVQRYRARPPGDTSIFKIIGGEIPSIYGLTCTSNIAGQLTVTISGPVSYVGPGPGALTPTVSGNTYTYNIPDFSQVDIFSDFLIELYIPPTAVIGTPITFSLNISPSMGDMNPVNNTHFAQIPIIGSYDPNEKEVYPAIVGPNYNGWLNYMVHFQNIGNAPAFNVRLEDTLASNLDWSTFQFIDASHYQTHRLVGNKLTVHYPNIQLPDSLSDPDGSQGYFQFRIKPIAGLGVGTTIENSAAIYFDYNAPIITNTATTEYQLITSIQEPEQNPVRVYPNPGNGIFNIEIPADWNQLEWNITDVTGRFIREGVANQPYQIDMSQQPQGFYLLKMTHNGRSYLTRLIKQ